MGDQYLCQIGDYLSLKEIAQKGLWFNKCDVVKQLSPDDTDYGISVSLRWDMSFH